MNLGVIIPNYGEILFRFISLQLRNFFNILTLTWYQISDRIG